MYQGKFKPKNIKKYRGDAEAIYYRSSWELAVMLWCDSNTSITEWSSEELVIPYLCPTDGSVHRYFIDFKIKFHNNKTYIVELKPKKHTIAPEQKSTKKRDRKQYITEVLSYVKNQAKWKAADAYAKKQGATFQVWTEDTLEQLGIKILGK
jgi:hypothetical protein